MTRKRSPNFIESERLLFSQLLQVHAPAIECKRSDAQTAKEKREAWEAIHASFNASTTYVTRTVDNLKSLWDNMKAQARKALGTERREMYGTGGGVINTEGLPTKVDEAVIAVIGKSATGLENPHDHDGVMMLPSFSNMKEENSQFVEADVTPIEAADLAKALQEVNESADWSQFKAPLLMTPKAAPLKVPSSRASASPSTGDTDLSGLKKRSLKDEAEYLKNVKRRRPVLEEASKKKEEMYEARTALCNASREHIMKEKEREEALFELEKKKKEYEVKMMKLQMMKMKKDLGLDLEDSD